MVDIHSNPLYYAASGGLILGLSISLHYIMKGNVTGMSGILYGVASMNKSISSLIQRSCRTNWPFFLEWCSPGAYFSIFSTTILSTSSPHLALRIRLMRRHLS